MFGKICLFELEYQSRQPLFRLSVPTFFLLGLALASSDIGNAIGNAPGTTLRNAPILVVHLMPVISLLGLFVVTAFVAGAALRDFEQRSDMLFFTKPVRELDFFGGRFAGSMLVSFLVLLAAAGGMVAGHLAPWQPPDRVGPMSWGAYLFGIGVVLVPNLLIMGALFFALAMRSRRLGWTYLCVVFFIGMQDALELAAQGLSRPLLGSLLEPTGIVALDGMARYWTVAEQNSRLPELTTALAGNRALWMALALGVLVLALRRFDPSPEQRSKAAKDTVGSTADRETRVDRPSGDLPDALAAVSTRFSRLALVRRMLRQTRIELSEVVAGAPFLTLLALGLLFVAVYGFLAGMHNGVPSFPLTHLMIGAIGLGIRLGLVLMVVVHAGELMFDRRSLKLSGLYDALPVPDWLLFGAKTLALFAIIGLFLLFGTITTVLIQLAKGHGDLDPALYLEGLLLLALPLVPLVALALFLQVLSDRKFLGLLATGLVLLLGFALPRLGLEDNLYLFGKHPPLVYSTFDGYGHGLTPYLGFLAYWSCAAVVLATLSLLFWPRGIEMPLAERLRVARKRLGRPALATLGLAGLTMVGIGSWLFHNTHVRGQYFDRQDLDARLAHYERAYDQYADLPLPRIFEVDAEIDLYPSERRAEIRGTYSLRNTGTEPIRRLPITRSPRWVEGVLQNHGGVSFESFDLPPHERTIDDDELGFYLFELEEPLGPGENMELGFRVKVDHSAFRNSRQNHLLVKNGTFFSRRNFFPVLGYARANALSDPAERERFDLPAGTRMARLEDAEARQRNYLESDWTKLRAVLSTEADQIAIAPGDLVKEWTEGDRRYFHYETRAPVVNLLPFLSGIYEVRRDRWQDVAIEIYFDPDHVYNIDRFIETTKQSLAYMSEQLSPYPHGQLRIVEVPRRHGQVAFSFPQTIAYSEAWSFTADLEDAPMDWLAGILAHEVAHQWWNHQVVPADVQGSTLIAEALAQYSAMMILERMYGPEALHPFLEFHLDQYLQRRGDEKIREMPLARVENQGYIHYSKASLVLYRLRHQIGEEAVNRALRAFLESHAFAGPPYPTSEDLLDRLRQEVPAADANLVEDLFETITLFDNRLLDATYRPLDDGRYEVRLEISAQKLRDDGSGNTHEIPVGDWMELAIFAEAASSGESGLSEDAEDEILLLEKHRIAEADRIFTFVVDQKPVRAGIDPFHRLIDRDKDDNIRDVERASTF